MRKFQVILNRTGTSEQVYGTYATLEDAAHTMNILEGHAYTVTIRIIRK